MPRSAVTRFLVVLVLAVAGGVAAFTWWTTRTSGLTPTALEETPAVAQGTTAPVADSAADVALYDRRCGTCHQRDDLVPWVRAAGGPEAQRQALVDLLARHGSATPDEAVRLADYLVRLAGLVRAAGPVPDQGGFDPLVAQAELLRDALGSYRALAAAPDWAPDIPPIDGVIRQGDWHPALPAVRERLVRLGDLMAGPGGEATFDASLEAGLRRFQRRHGLSDDGVIGPATEAALRQSPDVRVAQIEAALARLAALPEQPADRTIVVNIPMFHLWAWEAGSPDRPALGSRVIVGQPTTPTPEFDAMMREVVFRPAWNVPLSIARNEIVPRLRRDPAYLTRQRIDIVAADGAAAQAPLSEATLAAIAAGSLRVRQRPGPDNALGLVKFVQPNPHAVYLHDTPNHRLFDAADRALSHGCVRVDEAAALAEWLLADPVGWARPQIEAHLYGDRTVTVPIARAVLTRLVYLRAMVWPDGTVHFAPDRYRQDTGPTERAPSECAVSEQPTIG